MTAGPSIKGAVIKALVQDTRDGLADGRITRAAAEQQLTAEELQLLQDEILDTGWYPIDSYRRLSDLLDDQLGARDVRYIQKRGAAVAERLIRLGVYQQVSFLNRVGAAESMAVAYQNLKLTATLWNSFFNFGVWTTSQQPESRTFAMQVSQSEAMPEKGWDAVEGFIWRLTQEVDPEGVTLKRETTGPGSVQFVFHISARTIPPGRRPLP